jgi:hypothetical protein
LTSSRALALPSLAAPVNSRPPVRRQACTSAMFLSPMSCNALASARSRPSPDVTFVMFEISEREANRETTVVKRTNTQIKITPVVSLR